MRHLLCALAAVSLSLSAPAQGLNAKLTSAEPKQQKVLWVALTTNTNVPCSVTNLQFCSATFYGYKASTATNAPTPNTATAYLCAYDPSTTNVASFGTIAAGSWVQLTGVGAKYNLADLAAVGTTGDKLLIVYEQ